VHRWIEAKRYENAQTNQVVRDRRSLVDRATAYRQQPFNVTSTVELLEWVAGQLQLVGSDVAHEAGKLAQQLTYNLGAVSAPKAQVLVATRARRLRSTAESYSDDGTLTARQAYSTQAVFNLLDDHQRDLLESRCSW
ncbi:MAG: hypothetical protein KDB50_02560, partial [Mycobacterium sp.]|nr:hypothetical protein [Mycobacterium sp.]